MESPSSEGLRELNPWWAKAIECLSSLENAELESQTAVVAAEEIDVSDGAAEKSQLIKVTIKIAFNIQNSPKNPPEPFTILVPQGTVLKKILNIAQIKNGAYRYTTKYYEGLGHMITSMDGVFQVPKKNLYWMIYESPGVLTPTGIDEFQPKDGSTTIFQYENPGNKQ